MPRDTYIPKFRALLEDRYRVERWDSTENVFELYRANLDRQHAIASSLVDAIRKGDFALYVLESAPGWWSPTPNVIESLNRRFEAMWAMVLLDGSSTNGHFFTSENVKHSHKSWGITIRITKVNPGHCTNFHNRETFEAVLGEAFI